MSNVIPNEVTRTNRHESMVIMSETFLTYEMIELYKKNKLMMNRKEINKW